MDAKICAKINGDYDSRRRQCTIKHIDEVRGMGAVPDGWYRVPGMEGYSWSHYTKGKRDFILEGSEDEDRRMLELWVGDNTAGDSESISWHRKGRKLEEAAKKWISDNPEGWE